MQIKGSAVASTLRAIERVHGKAGLGAVRATLPDHLRSIIQDDLVLPVRWYPVELVAAIHIGVRDALGQGDWEASRLLGVTAAREDFSSIYAVAVRVLDPNGIWSRMERMWSVYNSRGNFVWLAREPGCLHAIVRDVSGYNLGMWNAVAGRAQQLMTMTGTKAADVTVSNATAKQAEFQAMWLE
jgi:hypothetical protein